MNPRTSLTLPGLLTLGAGGTIASTVRFLPRDVQEDMQKVGLALTVVGAGIMAAGIVGEAMRWREAR